MLVFFDCMPFPPRNGITIPMCHYVKAIASEYALDLIVYSDYVTYADDVRLISHNKQFFRSIHIIRPDSRNKYLFILLDLFCIRPYVARWKLSDASIGVLKQGGYDVVFVSALKSAYAYYLYGRFGNMVAPIKTVALLNDSYSMTLASYRNLITWKPFMLVRNIKYVFNCLRSFSMQVFEKNLCEKFDQIIVQTEKDKLSISSVVNHQEKIVVIPNGVESVYFTEPSLSSDFTIGFVGALDSWENLADVDELLNVVWPKIKELNPNIKLKIVGKTCRQNLITLLRTDPRIDYHSFVDDVTEIFSGIDLLYVPNYRQLGIINRTIQAMAHSIVVVGHKGAFHGIEGFQDGVHGYVVNSLNDVVELLHEMLENTDVLLNVKTQAFIFAKQRFTWDSRYLKFNEIINCQNTII